jgi:hypothetical protein
VPVATAWPQRPHSPSFNPARRRTRSLGSGAPPKTVKMTAQVAPACNDAWASPPITTSADMNLGDWGPHDMLPSIVRLQSAIACRFGWRRITSLLGFPDG